jgi:hypothetical protein
LGPKIYWNDFNDIGVDLGKFWGEEFEFDESFLIGPSTGPGTWPREARNRKFSSIIDMGGRFRVILGWGIRI